MFLQICVPDSKKSLSNDHLLLRDDYDFKITDQGHKFEEIYLMQLDSSQKVTLFRLKQLKRAIDGLYRPYLIRN